MNTKFYKIQNLYTIKHLLQKTIHVGHTKNNRHINNTNLIIGHRNRNDILDLNQTINNLSRAIPLILTTLTKHGTILCINLAQPNKEFVDITKHYATTDSWMPGSLSNFKKLRPQLQFQYLPNITFQITFQQNYAIAKEISLINLPKIAITDSNANSHYYNYPIPGNDDSFTSQKFYLTLLKQLIFTAFLSQKLKHQTTTKKVLKKLTTNLTS